MSIAIPLEKEKIEDFCQRWMIVEFSLFGSVLREDFGPESDVDVLVSFGPDVPWSLFDWIDMIDELQEIFGRKVHLLEKDTIRNPFRRHGILKTKDVIYVRSEHLDESCFRKI